MFEINSHTPSEAMIMNLSAAVSWSSKIYGSAMTPAFAATESPIERVIASPGTSSYFSHTLKGPIGYRFWSNKDSLWVYDSLPLKLYILPPFPKILLA